MRRAREKRMLTCWLALAAPIPLPFNQVLAWPLLFLYEALVVAGLQRAERGEERWLPNWALNVLGLVYLPLFFFDLRAAYWRGRMVTALLHLLLFVVVVKLWSMRREGDKWHALVAIFFLFVGSMATSSHVTIALYLIGFGILGLWALGRLAQWYESDGVGLRRPGEERVPWVRKLRPAVAGVLITALAIPVFVLVPRTGEPFVLGRGAGGAALARTSGFSDVVDLSLTSSIRANRNVVLRLDYGESGPGSARFKAATYEWYEDRQWHRAPSYLGLTVRRSDEGFLVGRRDLEADRKVEIWQEPISSASLVLPVTTVRVAMDGVMHLMRDPGGAIYLPSRPRDTFHATAFLADRPGLVGRLERGDARDALTALDDGGITARIRDLAREVVGDASPTEAISRIEGHLLSEYSYTLDFLGRDGSHPIEDFLFVHRSGHCELFASAMVMMLRAEGIPARLAAGYLGAEFNPLEDYYIVRQQNAHAWVEAWTEEGGWQIADPTPPEGRPMVAEQSIGLLAQQMWDWVTFRWDRYVLTYGAADQAGIFQGLRERFEVFWEWLTGPEEDSRATEPVPPGEEGLEPGQSGRADAPDFWDFEVPPVVIVLIVLVAGLLVLRAIVREPENVTEVWLRTRRWVGGRGIAVPPSRPPRELADAIATRYPAVAEPVDRLLGEYLRESFAGEEAGAESRKTAAEAWEEIRRGVRESLKGERRSRSGRSGSAD